MALKRYNHGKFFGPSLSYAGLVFTATGIFVAFYHVTALILLIPGLFLALTTNGTVIDTGNLKVRSLTRLFGIIPVGKWYDTCTFSGFTIEKVRSRYTTYSRSNLRLDTDKTDIRLVLVSKASPIKIIVNKYPTFEDARNALTELSALIFPETSNDITEN
ncbi:MAG TPA: hypothetical protein VJ963_08905 [Bacteroidales bacterium]|nr:hypothetical protein [Bacteroidales bacterium]